MREKKVMLDSGLAELYEVETRALILASVKRNIERFPDDFMFRLTNQEAAALRSRIVMSKPAGRGGASLPALCFHRTGVAMLSSVLKSNHAVQMNILIMRAFVRFREVLAANEALARRIDERAATKNEHAIALVGVIRKSET